MPSVPSTPDSATAARVEPSARVMKRVAALGHHLAVWTEALGVLRNRLQSGGLDAGIRAHVEACLVGMPVEPLPNAMAVDLLFPLEDPANWCVDSQGADGLPALRAGARALLHLPALRRTWASWLRGSVLDDLRLRLGRAWVVDPAPMPVHGAIHGLGLAQWADFHRLAGSGRSFKVSFTADEAAVLLTANRPLEQWRVVADRLAECALGGALIEELSLSEGWRMRAEFAQKDERWEMTTAHSKQKREDR